MVVRVSLIVLLLAAPAPPVTQPSVAQYAPLSSAAIGTWIAEWTRLRQTDSLPFSAYANFMVAHPGWPGETAMRKTAERALTPETMEPRQATAFFDRFAPLTNTGQARYAEALVAIGRNDEAKSAARKAWTSGSLSTLDETRMLSGFGGTFTAADQDERMDRLLWAGATAAAQRQLPLVSPGKRALFDARLALRARTPDAVIKADAVDASARTDAGYLADKALWLRAQGQAFAARQLLAAPRRLTTRPSEPEKWFETLLLFAREAQNDGQYQVAYDIARQVDDALAPGTDIRDQALGVRDDYTSVVWRAGMTALVDLRRPAEAIASFERYAGGAKSPQTQSKGHYWAGRAAKAAGRDPAPYFERAAAFSDQFYGQLALERLGRPVPPPPVNAARAPSAGERQAFQGREIVQAARYLGQTGNWQDQTQFIRAIAASVESDADHVLADEVARQIGRPDLAVMVGRMARNDGRSDYVRAGFPEVRVPDGYQGNWTIIHAISRQESQFDRAIVSHAGARGLMQLMPATARQVAGQIGLGYMPDALTTDTVYNIQLGSSYFQKMLDYYGGSYPLAVAAYNAGPGNVNKWLKANGDPRLPGGDITLWIENIPIYETKNYVHRVLENAVVYDTLNPARARVRTATPLSTYLGKSAPG